MFFLCHRLDTTTILLHKSSFGNRSQPTNSAATSVLMPHYPASHHHDHQGPSPRILANKTIVAGAASAVHRIIAECDHGMMVDNSLIDEATRLLDRCAVAGAWSIIVADHREATCAIIMDMVYCLYQSRAMKTATRNTLMDHIRNFARNMGMDMGVIDGTIEGALVQRGCTRSHSTRTVRR